MSATLAVAKLQFRILRRDPWFLVIMFGMPLVVMPLFKQTMGISLNASGFENATGAEQVVPGWVVMFSFFVAGSTAFSVFREHGWKTWDRLRASSATPVALLSGFALPWIVVHVAYQAALYGVSAVLLGLRPPLGAIPALFALFIAYGACVVALILLVAASFCWWQRHFERWPWFRASRMLAPWCSVVLAEPWYQSTNFRDGPGLSHHSRRPTGPCHT